ncbi:Putative RNA recognition motif domain, nucleotide-binding alpha-beta plait domain superfamily [Septoria linicola]|uniref:RNA recognition motif domain, nucleotide-binding alpha-beta plait domain superfamily n=1 Tax=Septoria linicola TaxID=215465 RepID=A0A9Q9EN58_9PEZI|nr:putative RNA recognition motif domain, nucleotide-binding alpha-beta plait domain superfamily [Septoria linicola]USW55158.1 Putative RNA recognition motif domain, nucleotide-binding alpha-beta plait domain superfamily [Septoria linicola]
MPPQIKQDLNRSGWETTDLPSVCEKCLSDNPYVQMLKEDYGEACKLCTRPFTVFRWKADRTARQKRTGICLTCARLKNCCQCCMLDLSFGLPITIRDAALKMVAPGPQSEINREYFAQNNEREIEEGRGLEGYSKTEEKGRELLRRLANSEPYYKKQRRLEAEEQEEGGQKLLEGGEAHTAGPIRTQDSRGKSAYGSAYGPPVARGGGAAGARGGRGGARGGKGFPSGAALPPKPQDIAPPADKNITSLFVTGVEDDLPEHAIREHFSQHGALRSLICSHRSHCAFVNYMDREGAEKAAKAFQGRAVVKGVPLRVQWGKPKPLDNMDRDQRMENARAGRQAGAGSKAVAGPAGRKAIAGSAANAPAANDFDSLAAVAPPPGQGDVEYASLAGE